MPQFLPIDAETRALAAERGCARERARAAAPLARAGHASVQEDRFDAARVSRRPRSPRCSRSWLRRSKAGIRGFSRRPFPPVGRTTRDGRVFVHGVPLEDTEYPSGGGRTRSARRPRRCSSTRACAPTLVPLATVRAGGDSLRATLAAIQNRGGYRGVVAVCDAETDQTSTASSPRRPHAPGTTLSHRQSPDLRMRSRAPAVRRRGQCARSITPSNRGALIVVGSLADPRRLRPRSPSM